MTLNILGNSNLSLIFYIETQITLDYFLPRKTATLVARDHKLMRLLIIFIFAVCNITIDSGDLVSRSGQRYGEIKSSPGMAGPVFCWYR